MKHSWKFNAIGTTWQIDLDGAIDDDQLAGLKQRVAERIEAFDKTYSRFRSDSELMEWVTPGTYPMPPDGVKLFDFYKQLYDATDGRVTPLIGTVMSEAGYDAAYSFKAKPLTTPPKWEDALEYNEQTIMTKLPVILDVGAAGKGYLIDIIIELITAEYSADTVVINAGGDIRHFAREQGTPVVIGLQNPFDHRQIVGTASIDHQSLCASSGSKRKWGKFHHIIDPTSLESPAEIAATWARADMAMVADGIATALFFCEPAALGAFNFSYAMLRSDMKLTYSPNFLSEVFTA